MADFFNKVGRKLDNFFGAVSDDVFGPVSVASENARHPVVLECEKAVADLVKHEDDLSLVLSLR